jgi:elongation factor Ts
MTMDMEKVKEVRARTQASLSACKRVVEQTGGDVESAIVALQKSGEAKAASRAGRIAAEGKVYTYRHPGDRIAVIVELNCETDFAARSSGFEQLCDEVAMQVAGMGARYVSRADVPAEDMRAQELIWCGPSGPDAATLKEAERAGKIVAGKREKWLKEVCLLEQPMLSNPSRTVEQAIASYSSMIGEKIAVRRFVRWELAEGLERKAVEDYASEVAKLAGG